AFTANLSLATAGDPGRRTARRRAPAFDQRPGGTTAGLANRGVAGLRPIAGRRLRARPSWVGDLRFIWTGFRSTVNTREAGKAKAFAIWSGRKRSGRQGRTCPKSRLPAVRLLVSASTRGTIPVRDLAENLDPKVAKRAHTNAGLCQSGGEHRFAGGDRIAPATIASRSLRCFASHNCEWLAAGARPGFTGASRTRGPCGD